MNDRQRRFVDEYLKDANAMQAAIRAGYSKRTAGLTGHRLIKNDKIAAAIAKRQEKAEQETDVTVARTLKELARIGFSDPRRILDENGKLLPVSEWPDEVAAAVSSIKTRRVVERHGDDAEPVEIVEVKLWSKNDALKQIAQHLGMLIERKQVDINIRHLDDSELDSLIAEIEAEGAGQPLH